MRAHIVIWMAGVSVFLLMVSAAVFLPMVSATFAQTSSEPFPSPIAEVEDVISVGIEEFASLPDVDGEAARMMHFMDEPGTERLFVSDMRGLLYGVSYDGQTVTPYLDLTAATRGLSVEATGRERGFQSFAFHPEFGRPGTPGFGRFYTYLDTSNTGPTPDFVRVATTARRTPSCLNGRPKRLARRPMMAVRPVRSCGSSSRFAITTVARSDSTHSCHPAMPTSD